MMSLDKVRAAVLEEASAEARKIIESAEKEAAAKLSAARNHFRERTDREIEAERARLQAERDRTIASAEREGRVKMLQVRNELVEQAIRSALESIEDMPDEEYRPLFEKLLAATDKALAGKLLVRTRDLELVRPLVERANSTRPQQCKLVLEDGGNVPRGFLIRSKKYEVNGLFSFRAEELRDELRTAISDVLFGENRHED